MNWHSGSECPAVLFLVFNRPDLTVRVFQEIRAARPDRLFIAADGPRADRSDDEGLCIETRSIVTQIDWPCEVHTLFRDKNLGCKRAVSSAITWFFQHVEEGIILEDDCLPVNSFFGFCAELLKRYRMEERIMMISGDNFVPRSRLPDYSYRFSIHAHIWGWATWRRAWEHYDDNLQDWPRLRSTSWLIEWLGDKAAAAYWRAIFDQVYAKQIDTWDYPWTYSCWVQRGFTVLPTVNLVSNIGFDERATHTVDSKSDSANLRRDSITFPLRHPTVLAPNINADQYTTRHHFGVSFTVPAWGRLTRRISRLLHHVK